MSYACTARVDDIWALFYIVDELVVGELPWSNDVESGSDEEYGEVYRKKLACIEDPRQLACGGLPVPGMYGITTINQYGCFLSVNDSRLYPRCMRSVWARGIERDNTYVHMTRCCNTEVGGLNVRVVKPTTQYLYLLMTWVTYIPKGQFDLFT
jgi:hypothetical protein